MLTRLRIRNFKKLHDMDVSLNKAVVLIGPNNSGKTTALQALSLWDIGLRLWNAKRSGKASPEKRPGVTINRKDLISIPVPSADLIWRDLHVRNVKQTNGKTTTQNIRIDVILDGISEGTPWSCGLEFDYSNEESFVCRPCREPGFEETPVKDSRFTSIPELAERVRVAYLPPMSGLAAAEPKWEIGRINVLLGEGQTAQVLRNLCYQVYQSTEDPGKTRWKTLVDQIHALFGIHLQNPVHVVERGEIIMQYEERNGTRLDLSSAGRGLQQTLLLLTHLYANPGTILLLDEPDAHLEILRQRQIYQIITDIADRQGSQVIAASHSEVVLNEAVGRGSVVAFVGKPHRLSDEDKGSQVLKSLTSIGFDQYYQAEQTGWVLYVEDSTDLSILRAFARLLGHKAHEFLDRPFVHYVATNLPQKARDHFFGLREGKSDLAGIAIFDRLEKQLKTDGPLIEMMWVRREIENYLCTESVLLAFAKHDIPDNLFGIAEQEKRIAVMRESISEVSAALKTLDKPNPWSPDIKATDEFLDPLFRLFFKKLSLPLQFRKADYYQLAQFVPADKIDPEVSAKLDLIVQSAMTAKPRMD
ncbi:MAG TPA: AAA family ATPase [Phycisphaerae bacterium]|jgi:energy-coupling factor transporter ATP-binding protein EcfA2